jgi:putative nucleotidyltransferase with HDIG domain
LLWKHSLTTAFACKFIADDLNADGNMLFTAGLVHDLGRVVLAQAKGAEYGKLYADALAAQVNVSERENAAYGFTHADVGAALLETWKLPPLMIEAVRYHHRPKVAGPAKQMAAAVCVANGFAHRFEHPGEATAGAGTEMESAQEMLSLGSRHMDLYDEQMQENWEFVNRLIQMR